MYFGVFFKFNLVLVAVFESADSCHNVRFCSWMFEALGGFKCGLLRLSKMEKRCILYSIDVLMGLMRLSSHWPVTMYCLLYLSCSSATFMLFVLEA